MTDGAREKQPRRGSPGDRASEAGLADEPPRKKSRRGLSGRLLPGSLSGQLLARSLLILAALLVLIGFMQNWLMKDSLYRSKADSLMTQLMSMPVGWFIDSDNAGRLQQPDGGAGDGSGNGNAGTASGENDGTANGSANGANDGTANGSANGANGGTAGGNGDGGAGAANNADGGAAGNAAGDGTAVNDGGNRADGNGRGGARPGGGNNRGGPADGRVPSKDEPFLFSPGTSLAFVGTDGSFSDLSGAYSIPSPRLSQSEYAAILQKLVADRGRKQSKNYSLLTDANGTSQIVVYRLAGQPDQPNGLLQMGAETSQLTDVMTRQLLIFASLSVLALTAGLALYMPVLRRTLVPLSRMGEAVKGIDAGNLAQRLPEHQGQEEIDRLSVSFNGMLERLDASFRAEQETTEAMRRFVADASHELRTPLTSIHGFLEVLLRGAASANPEQLQTALRSMHGESKRINKLVEDLLTLAKLDRAPQLKLVEASLDGLVRSMEPQLGLLAIDRSVDFRLEDGIRLRCDEDKIKQVLLNLFQNAVQHTDPGVGSISVSLRADRRGGERGEDGSPGDSRAFAELTVRDNGTGIDPASLPHLFERFYRSDSSRARKYGGSGLGLAITQSIVESHGGKIAVTSTVGEGSMFTVRLPI